MPKKSLGKRRWKRCDVHFVHGSPVDYDILHLSTKTEKMDETAIPMGKMLNAFLAIHGRCKFIIFLRGQTPSLSAPTLILSLMEHFQGKAKNTVKHSIKSTFSISIQLNCNWLPGNPQLPPYIYIYIHMYNHYILIIIWLSITNHPFLAEFHLKSLAHPHGHRRQLDPLHRIMRQMLGRWRLRRARARRVAAITHDLSDDHP